MAQISLSQSVLLAHGVFRFLTVRLLPSVSEVTLSVPATREIAKENCRAEMASNKEEESSPASLSNGGMGGRWTHLSQVQHSHISFPSPKKLAP